MTNKVNYDFPDKLGFLFDAYRNKVAYGGRGSGKSWGFARAILLIAAEQKKRVLCVREIQRSIKDSVHKLLSDQIEELGLEEFYTVMATEIRGANGTEILFSGLSNLTAYSLKSFEKIDIVWAEEAQAITDTSWDVLRPTIRADGSEIWVTMNPELNTDASYVRFIDNPPSNSYVQKLNYNDNPWFPKVLKAERRDFLDLVKRGYRKQADYDNIWLGVCRPAVEGAIYHDEVVALKESGRFCNVPYDPMHDVHTVWDLGRGNYMSIILFQKVAGEIRIINYIEDKNRTLADFVLTESEGKEDLASLKYRWGKDHLPHDGKHKTIHHKLNAIERLKELGRNVDDEPVPDIGIEPGIRAARQMFPRVVIDKTLAGKLLDRLGRYRRKVNKQTQQETGPEHNDDSDGADSYRYLAVIEDTIDNSHETTIKDPYAGFRKYEHYG